MIAKHTRALGLEGERNNGVGEGGRRGGGEGGGIETEEKYRNRGSKARILIAAN